MGEENKTVRDHWIPAKKGLSAVVQPAIQANNFELKPALINMVQQSRFGGSASEDPHEHIMNFLEYCNTLKCNGVTRDANRLSLFLFSIGDQAKVWYHSLP